MYTFYKTQPLQGLIRSDRPSPPTDYPFFCKADSINFFAGSAVLATDTEYQNVNKIHNGGPMCQKTVTTGQVSRVQVVKLITGRDNCQYQLIQVYAFNSNANLILSLYFLPRSLKMSSFYDLFFPWK